LLMKGALSLSGSDIQIIHVIFKGLVITADFGKLAAILLPVS
jgi:hypothetical protein